MSRSRNDLFQAEIESCSLSSVQRNCFLGLWILEFPDEGLFVTSLLLWTIVPSRRLSLRMADLD